MCRCINRNIFNFFIFLLGWSCHFFPRFLVNLTNRFFLSLWHVRFFDNVIVSQHSITNYRQMFSFCFYFNILRNLINNFIMASIYVGGDLLFIRFWPADTRNFGIFFLIFFRFTNRHLSLLFFGHHTIEETTLLGGRGPLRLLFLFWGRFIFLFTQNWLGRCYGTRTGALWSRGRDVLCGFCAGSDFIRTSFATILFLFCFIVIG